MAPAIVVSESGGAGSTGEFPAKLTKQVLICSIIAAFGGLMFGYDVGISGPSKTLITKNLLQQIFNIACRLNNTYMYIIHIFFKFLQEE